MKPSWFDLSPTVMSTVSPLLSLASLAVARLIEKRAEGNPFFAEELALSLRDRGVISIEDGVCRIVSFSE